MKNILLITVTFALVAFVFSSCASSGRQARYDQYSGRYYKGNSYWDYYHKKHFAE